MLVVASVVLLLAASLISNALALPHNRQSNRQSTGSSNAIYFLTNEQANSVVAVPIDNTGMLSGGTTTDTQGAGSNSIDGMTNEPAAPDPLIGQAALTVAGQNLFAVNAGSNTLSMFAINRRDPTSLTMVGQPATVQGEFPNTVAVSKKHNLACVATTGAQNGVSCATFSKQGLGEFDALRSFDLQQSTPPVGPTNSVSQLFFSEDESMLFATVKGDPAVNATGFLSAFPVQAAGMGNDSAGACLATQDTRSSPDGTAVLFGSIVVPGSSLVFATDASFGAAVLSVDPSSGEAQLVAMQAINDQAATCWATFSPATGSAFVTDVGRNRVVEMSVSDARILGVTDLAETGAPGFIDLQAAGNAVYVLNPGNGTTPAAVTVMDVSQGPGTASLMQKFDVSSLGAGANAQGMAILRK